MKKTILALSLIFFSFICFSFFKEKNNKARFVLAQEEEKKIEDLKKQIEKYEQKLIETQSKAKTLSSQITYMNTQITLTGLQIQETLEKIEKLATEIVSLSEKIERLEGSLTSVSEILLNRIVSTYKTGKVPPVYLLFSSEGFSDLLLRAKYLRIAQLHDKKLMIQMQSTKDNFSAQKDLREEKKEEQESLKAKLEIQKQALAQQKKDKENLLNVTKGEEREYQKLLAAAKAEIESLKEFSHKQSGGILPAQTSPDGWFYSQRDERWASKTIGYSSEDILDVGCLVSSVAMLFTYYGQRITPIEIANNTSYFFSGTAYMLTPWPVPSGKNYSIIQDQTQMDREIESGNPVIVHLGLGGDGHFIVLKKKEGGNYIMHDPWHGYDKNFSDFYSIANIDKIVVFK